MRTTRRAAPSPSARRSASVSTVTADTRRYARRSARCNEAPCASMCRCSCAITRVSAGGDRRRDDRERRTGRHHHVTRHAAQRSDELHVGEQARRRVRLVLGMDEQARQPGQPAAPRGLVLEHPHRDARRKRQHRPRLVLAHADDLDRPGRRERAGEVEGRTDRAAHPVGVREQQMDRPGTRPPRLGEHAQEGDRQPVGGDRRSAQEAPLQAAMRLRVRARRCRPAPRRPRRGCRASPRSRGTDRRPRASPQRSAAPAHAA